MVDGGIRVDLPGGEGPDAVIEEMFGPSLNRLSMSFDSEEDYVGYWRRHPALEGRWSAQLDLVFAYDVEPWRRGYRVRANREAILAGAGDFLFDEQTIKAVNEVIVPSRLIMVDHDLTDQRGGFLSEPAAEDAVSRNPNLSVERLRDLNHFTVLLGGGASQVASAIVRLL